MHLTAKTLEHVKRSYFQFRKKTDELPWTVPKKTLACALSSSATTQHKHFITGPEGPLLVLMHQCPTDEDFPRELRLWESPCHTLRKRSFSRSQSTCNLSYWAPTLNLTIQFLTTDCMTKFSTHGCVFHAVSHHQVSGREKHSVKELSYTDQT